MKLGDYQFIWWSVVEGVEPRDQCDKDDGWTFLWRRPAFGLRRNFIPGIYKWSVSIGYLEIRRFENPVFVP